MGKNYLTRGIDKVLILPFIQATIRTASKGKQKEIHDRSSVEVEQLLPVMEPVHDPRNLYASDSPEIEDPDSDEELYKSAEEVAEMIDLDGQGDGAANESNLGPNVFLLFDLRFADYCPRFTSFSAFVFTGVTFAVPGSLGTSSKSR
jgi:hypothetical protein